MTKRIVTLLSALSFLAAAPALAQTAPAPTTAPAPKAEKPKGKPTPQTHHCYKDGTLVADKTHKQCTAAGGEWKKDKDAAKGAAAKAPAADAAPAAVPAAK
jgi:hypothetical protein